MWTNYEPTGLTSPTIDQALLKKWKAHWIFSSLHQNKSTLIKLSFNFFFSFLWKIKVYIFSALLGNSSYLFYTMTTVTSSWILFYLPGRAWFLRFCADSEEAGHNDGDQTSKHASSQYLYRAPMKCGQVPERKFFLCLFHLPRQRLGYPQRVWRLFQPT